jgi:hypothetical protein
MSGGAVPRARLSCTNRARKSSCGLWIGFLNDLFYGPELYRRTRRVVNSFSAKQTFRRILWQTRKRIAWPY